MKTFAILIGVLVLASPTNADSHPKRLTIQVISSMTDRSPRQTVDLPPKGEVNRGDVIQKKSVLRNRVAQFNLPKGARVGLEVETYTVVSLPRGDVRIVAKLPGGTLRASGRTSSSVEPLRIAVVAGTGRFAGARGTLDMYPLDSFGADHRSVYRIVLP